MEIIQDYVINRIRAIYIVFLMKLRRLRLLIIGVTVKNDLRVYGNVHISGRPQNIHIGYNCSLNEGVFINGYDKVVIGNNCSLSPYVQLHSGYLKENNTPRVHEAKPIVIGNDVWLASGVIVAAGVKIGNNVIVGANSVVTKDLESGFLYAGIPTKKVRAINS